MRHRLQLNKALAFQHTNHRIKITTIVLHVDGANRMISINQSVSVVNHNQSHTPISKFTRNTFDADVHKILSTIRKQHTLVIFSLFVNFFCRSLSRSSLILLYFPFLCFYRINLYDNK